MSMHTYYDLELIKNVIAILKADNTNEGAITCIHNLVEDRIYQQDSAIPSSGTPRITVGVIIGSSQGSLPAEDSILQIKVWYDSNSGTPYATNCRKTSQRVIRLLNGKPGTVSSNLVIIRLIDLVSAMPLLESDTKLFVMSITFKIVYKVSKEP